MFSSFHVFSSGETRFVFDGSWSGKRENEIRRERKKLVAGERERETERERENERVRERHTDRLRMEKSGKENICFF